MDIVYLFKADPENNSEELRYSLRSLKNIPHNKVVIVGEKPAWVTNVEFIPIAQVKTKPENWGMNLSATVKSEVVSDDFIMMNDDFFIMKKILSMPNLNFGYMKDVIAAYDIRYPEGSSYIDRMHNLYDILLQGGYEKPRSYELHTPMVLNKQKVQQLYHDVAGRPLYQFRSYYGNYFSIGGISTNDVKIFNQPSHNDPRYIDNPREYLEAQDFLSTTGGAFKHGTPGDFIRDQFSEKSIYESDEEISCS